MADLNVSVISVVKATEVKTVYRWAVPSWDLYEMDGTTYTDLSSDNTLVAVDANIYEIEMTGYVEFGNYQGMILTEVPSPLHYPMLGRESLRLGGDQTCALVDVEDDILSITMADELSLTSNNISANISAVSITTYATKSQDYFRLGSDNIVTSVRATTLVSAYTTEDFVWLSSSPLQYITSITETLENVLHVEQGNVVGIYLDSTNSFDIVDLNIKSYEMRRPTLELHGDNSYSLFNAPIVSFTQTIDDAMILTGSMAANDNMGSIDELYETWVMNEFGFDVSMYSKWNFNSYAKIDGQYFGCMSDGVYLLEGDSDNGSAINSGIRCGPHNFGIVNRKYIRSIRLFDCGDTTRVRVANSDESVEVVAEKDRDYFIASQSVLDSNLIVDIQNFDTIGHMELNTVVIVRI